MRHKYTLRKILLDMKSIEIHSEMDTIELKFALQ